MMALGMAGDENRCGQCAYWRWGQEYPCAKGNRTRGAQAVDCGAGVFDHDDKEAKDEDTRPV